MKQYLVMEVISGLGMGGAEKSFLSRLSFIPENFQTIAVNTRPELDSWRLPAGISSVNCSRKNLKFFFRLNQEIHRFSPDAVIVRSPIDLLACSLLKRFTRRKWKLVYEAHSVEISQNLLVSKILTPLVRIANSQTDLVIAVSRSVTHGPQCRGAKKLEVHHVGALAKIQQDSNRSLTFLFIARFVPLKQPLLLLEAIRLSADVFLGRGAKVKIIGKGPLEGEMARFIEANNLGEIVEVCGYRHDLSPIYSESEYLLSTSKFEGLPITFFEAKIHGLRIITTPSSGDFDILGPEDSVLPDFTVETLANSLKGALKEGLLTEEHRVSIQQKNAWMQAGARAQIYYELIESELTKER